MSSQDTLAGESVIGPPGALRDAIVHLMFVTMWRVCREGRFLACPLVTLRGDRRRPGPLPRDRPLRVGVLPIVGNPITLAHILMGMLGLWSLDLDTVVFIIHGAITHKPVDTSARVSIEARHRMARAALRPFFPMLLYSDVAKDSDRLGEQTVHALRWLNKELPIEFVYLSGFENKRRFLFMAMNLVRFAEESRLWCDPQHRLSWCLFERAGRVGAQPLRLPNRWGSGRVQVPISVVYNPYQELSERLSSSSYRASLQPDHVCPVVHEYVLSHGFYRGHA